MRFSVALVLPALAAAQGQVPFLDQAKGWYEKGQTVALSLYSDAANAIAAATAVPVRAAASTIAGKTVTPLHMDTWQNTIKHTGNKTPYNSPEAWMVYVTGENKTCLGLCERADAAWNKSVALFATDVSSPNLATINCETDEMLCGTWMAEVPSIFLFLVPQPMPDQSRASTAMYFYPLNYTGVTSDEITKIHTRRTYLTMEPYQGSMHPFDGWVARYGLLFPISYFLYYLGKIPNWLMMLIVTYFSRSMVSKRLTNAGRPPLR